MRFKVLGQSRRNLARSAAVVMVGALAAGCSSSASRFDDFYDNVITGSTANQRQIISKTENQPFPGDAMAPAPVNGVAPQTISQSALAPIASSGAIQRSTLAPASTSVNPAPKAAAAPALDSTSAGWAGQGGTEVSIRPGDTIYNLSRRFGVPADAIMKANGISDASSLAAGRTIVIPTSVGGKDVPVSAPDNNPEMANAGAVSPRRPDQNAPAAPAAQVAMLPQTPKLKEPQAASTTAATSAATEGRAGNYTVVAGDTLFGIAKKTGASAEAIKSANGLSGGFLQIGQVLKIPTAAGAQVASSKVDPEPTLQANAPRAEVTAEPAAYTPPASKQKLVEQVALNPSEEAPDSTGVGRMRWPVRGRVISGFGGSRGNDGIDIAVPEGTPVKAAENGVVIYAGDGLKEFGNTVLVRHEDGLVTVYGHASEIKVARGDTVRRGQEIARSGMSGSAETPQLHFEVREESAPVDPTKFLE